MSTHENIDYEKLHNAHNSSPHVEEGEGPWLMSFADMVTLLMCFFILFFQTDKGNIKLDDPEKLLEKLEQFQKLLGMQEDSEVKIPDFLNMKSSSGASGSVDSFKKSMRAMSSNLDLVFTIGSPQPGEIDLTFLNTRFFHSGSADLTPKGKAMLKGVVAKLKKTAVNAEIEVEGHTDSDPIRNWKFPSNWELSSGRASTVVRLLSEYGVDPKHLKATGRSNFDPIVPEEDAQGNRLMENKALNRRIVIKVKHKFFENPDNDAVKPTRKQQRPKPAEPDQGP